MIAIRSRLQLLWRELSFPLYRLTAEVHPVISGFGSAHLTSKMGRKRSSYIRKCICKRLYLLHLEFFTYCRKEMSSSSSSPQDKKYTLLSLSQFLVFNLSITIIILISTLSNVIKMKTYIRYKSAVVRFITLIDWIENHHDDSVSFVLWTSVTTSSQIVWIIRQFWLEK